MRIAHINLPPKYFLLKDFISGCHCVLNAVCQTVQFINSFTTDNNVCFIQANFKNHFHSNAKLQLRLLFVVLN